MRVKWEYVERNSTVLVPSMAVESVSGISPVPPGTIRYKGTSLNHRKKGSCKLLAERGLESTSGDWPCFVGLPFIHKLSFLSFDFMDCQTNQAADISLWLKYPGQQ